MDCCLCKGECPHRTAELHTYKASPERGGGPAKLVEGFSREVQLLGLPCRNRPAKFALSACGLPTPVVALACIGNVGIQMFSGENG